jgi:hypothetical protein
MNLLIACSIDISSEKPAVFIGPQIDGEPLSFSSASTKVFLRSLKVVLFKKKTMKMDRADNKHSIVSCLKQLTRSFEYHLTYACLRVTSNEFSDIRLMPATAFTLCDLFNQDKYSSNYTFASKLSSLLLQKFAIAFYEK